MQDDGCLYPGALDMTSCIGAPVILTLPHMLDTDNHYSKLIDGMSPNAEEHKIEIVVEPVRNLNLAWNSFKIFFFAEHGIAFKIKD